MSSIIFRLIFFLNPSKKCYGPTYIFFFETESYGIKREERYLSKKKISIKY